MDRLRLFFVACVLGSACGTPTAIVLHVSADAPAEQYDLYVRDDDLEQIVFHSGFSSFSPPGAHHDLTKEKVNLAVKLSRGGRFTVLLVGVVGPVVNGKPGPTATQLFWAGRWGVGGTISTDARLLTVPKGDDKDGDLWPDAADFRAHVPAAQELYNTHPELLDCNDKIDNPTVSGKVIRVLAADVNPFAVGVCGDGYDHNCLGMPTQCVDNDHDGDPRGSDCDDNDPKRHHATAADPFPDPANCCGMNLGKTAADRFTDYLHAPGEAGCFAARCERDTILCPMKRCGDGIDESCAGKDTACVIDEDCDGYPPPPQGNDCNDHDPNTYPGAPEACNATKDLNCDGVIGGCVPCDLDGDGQERQDPTNGCNPMGMGKPVDCNDYDSGVFLNQTATLGGTEGGTTAIQHILSALRSNCRTVYESTGAVAIGTRKVAPPASTWMIGDADCNGTAYQGCPNSIAAGCDVDEDGFPNAGVGCNPSGLAIDCNDADPTIFPGAPDYCGDGIAQNCTSDTACTNDLDGDHYNAPGDDCDDNDRNVHPWAVELCDGKDNDCDGLKDEGNADPTGKFMITGGAITQCTASNTGECGKTKGLCVCGSAVQPGAKYNAANRTACPGENDGPSAAPKCQGAGQPKPQTCDACNQRDDDCDGRLDAPDGVNLAIKGMPCPSYVPKGQCKAGLVVACNYGQTSCFGALDPKGCPGGGHSVDGYVCDATAVCPLPAELCNGLDDTCVGALAPGEQDADGDGYIACGYPPIHPPYGCAATLRGGLLGCGDCEESVSRLGVTPANIHPNARELCNGVDDDCNDVTADGSGECPGTTKPNCCGAATCKDLSSDLGFCGTCFTACNLAVANLCIPSGCSCGGGPVCTGGYQCTGGSCTKPPGTACGGNGECTSGHCVNGVCCNVSGCAICQTCNGTSPGNCSAITSMDDPSCAPTSQKTCDATGACKLKNGQGCGAGNQCASGNCVNGACCSSSACGVCSTCNGTTPGSCSSIVNMDDASCAPMASHTCNGAGQCKLKPGQPCAAPSDCAVGTCSDGVCCNVTCTGQCQSCKELSSLGTCVTVSGAPRAGHPACTGSAPCTGSCDGTNPNVCTYPTTACGMMGCVAGSPSVSVYTQGSCSGGSCTGAMTTSCNGYICTAGACLTACTTDAQCALGDYCASGGTCQTRKVGGMTCDTVADCQVAGCRVCAAASGFCRFGVCCNTSCNNGNPSTCAAATETDYSCPGGTCTTTPKPCAPYRCSGGACNTTCAADTDCTAGNWCAKPGTTHNPGGTSACTSALGSGATCLDTDCVVLGCRQCGPAPTACGNADAGLNTCP